MNQKSFWDNKILTWERDRYGDKGSSSLLESFARRASSSLHRRIELTIEILEPRVAGKNILELGCGTGRLAESLILAGALTYTGIDIAKTAVDIASRNAEDKGLSNVVHFEAGEVRTASRNDVDIVFSLGLLDWLTDDEIEHIFSNFKGADFLHSISEKRFSVQQVLHRLYCYVAYGYKTNGYVPRYQSIDQIVRALEKSSATNLSVIRDPGMKFGTLLTSFRVPGSDFVENSV